jgi:hypothetical protein
MDASQTSDLILSIIKKSNLNFSLSDSPFSVTIQVKKTFIRDRDGSTRSFGIDENSNYCPNSQNSHENLYKDQQHIHDVHGVPHLSKALQPQLVHATHYLKDQVLPQHKGSVVPTSLPLTQQHQNQISTMPMLLPILTFRNLLFTMPLNTDIHLALSKITS